MNGLLINTLPILPAFNFFKKKKTSPVPLPDPELPNEPETGDYQDHLGRGDSDASVNADVVNHQIQASTRILQQSCKKVEKQFLGIGERLQTIYGQASDLTRKASSTVEQMGTDTADNVLTRVTQTAGESLGELIRNQTRIQDNLIRVVTIGDQLQELAQMGEQLRSIARFLKMIGINICIESSRSDDAEDIFVSLAKEIRELSITVTRVARSFGSDIHRVHTHLQAMHQQMCTKLDHSQQLAEAAKNAIEHAAPNVQAIIHRSVDALAHMGENAQAISQSVAHIVVSLQIHDNVSQRVEHIVEALVNVTQRREPQPSDDGLIEDDGSTLAALDANLALQIAQLEQVINDVENAHQAGTRAFEEIGRTIEDIARHMTLVGSDRKVNAADDVASSSSVEALQKKLQETSAMIGRGNETIKELQSITQNTTAAISRVEQHMNKIREVNFDIHLKSLNAMFKSMRLGGKGKAIQALVQEMKDLANQSDGFVHQVNDVSSAILEAANTLRDQFDSKCDHNIQGFEGDSRSLEADIEGFSVARKVFKQSTEETVALGHHLSELIEHAASELIFVQNFARDLSAELGKLQDLRRQISPDGEIDHSHLSLAQEKIAASYTMQQERDIHHRILFQGADSTDDENITNPNRLTETDAPECRTTDETSCEQFDENIELF